MLHADWLIYKLTLLAWFAWHKSALRLFDTIKEIKLQTQSNACKYTFIFYIISK